MNLNITKRKVGAKSDVNHIRREGNVPAIVYAQGKVGDAVVVNGDELQAVFRKMKKGYLPTTVFTLKDEENNQFEAIVKGIQYHPTTYKILHMDFVRLIDDVKVNVKVPIQCVGMAECTGIKLGGVLRQVIRQISVSCLPRDIPKDLVLDVRDLVMNQSHKLNKIAIPKGVKALCSLNEVVAVIVKR